jgi:hypothetical protein
VEVSNRQQVGLAIGQPCARGSTLTLGTVPVATAVVRDPSVATVLASLDMTAQGRRAAMLDRRHDLELSSGLQFSPKVGFENSLIGVPFGSFGRG